MKTQNDDSYVGGTATSGRIDMRTPETTATVGSPETPVALPLTGTDAVGFAIIGAITIIAGVIVQRSRFAR